MIKFIGSFLRHLGIAAMLIVSAYTILLKDVPFPNGINRYAAWLFVMIISPMLIMVSVLVEAKMKSNKILQKCRIAFAVIGISFTAVGVVLMWRTTPVIIGSCFLLAAIGFFGCAYTTVQMKKYEKISK